MNHLHPVFAAALQHLPEELTGVLLGARAQALGAREAYEQACADAGREVDPIMADIIYQRELCRAEGRIYFAGD